MTVKQLDKEEIINIYNTYMVKDFPESELKPMDRILYTVDAGICRVYGVYKDEHLCAYMVFIMSDTMEYMLLDYLAVLKTYRGQGIGHEIFENLDSFAHSQLMGKRGMYIECESVESSGNTEERNTRKRRIDFYESCGCIKTGLKSNLFTVEYNILMYPFKNSYKISEADGENIKDIHFKNVDEIYKTMFKKKHYRENVKLWKE